MPLVPALRQNQADDCEFEASLVNIVSYRTARSTWRDPVSNKQNKNTKHKSTVIPQTGTKLTEPLMQKGSLGWRSERAQHTLNACCCILQ